MTGLLDVTVVVPTLGRPSLSRLLASLAAQPFLPAAVVVADDRRGGDPLDLARGRTPLHVVRTGGRGPAAARNAGWRSARTGWVAFLDDDVLLPAGWAAALAADLAAHRDDERVAGITGRIVVPLPADRRPTDWERSTAGLEKAHWATADMVVRRAALEAVAGFDERFPRAYREDADLALRLRREGGRLVVGERNVLHPVRPAPASVSLRVQRGNADDALMRALHGPGWRADAMTGSGALGDHLVTVGAAGAAATALLAGRRRAAVAAALTWAGATARFAARRVAPGPRTPGEVATMAWTSVAIPFAAVGHRARGALAHRAGAAPWPPAPAAVLFDRDGTLVHDVPYNGDPGRVVLVDGAREQVARLRAAGLRVGLVSNQSGVARGLLARGDVDAVNARVADLVGGLDTVQVCPHGPDGGCRCRKPEPGLVLAAAAALGVPPHACVVIGDVGADVGAAVAAGARAVLVPTPVTRPEEVEDAPASGAAVVPDLAAAVDHVLAAPALERVP